MSCFRFISLNWAGASQDGRWKLVEHFREHWRDIMDDEESNRLERCLLIIEYPMTLARKVRACIWYYITDLNGFIDIWIQLTIFLLLLFYSLLYRYRAKVHTVVHSLQYHLRYHPSGWAFTSWTVSMSMFGDGNYSECMSRSPSLLDCWFWDTLREVTE